MVKYPCFLTARGTGSIPGQRTEIPHAAKKVNKIKLLFYSFIYSSYFPATGSAGIIPLME